MTSLEVVRAAVIKAVPEIMRTECGCLVKYKGAICGILPTGMMTDIHQGAVSLYSIEGRKDWYTLEEAEILGRPIRLADVLLAVQLHDLPDGYLFFNANWRGNLELSGIAGQKFAPWNLCNDDLTAQSEECLAFLAELLK